MRKGKLDAKSRSLASFRPSLEVFVAVCEVCRCPQPRANSASHLADHRRHRNTPRINFVRSESAPADRNRSRRTLTTACKLIACGRTQEEIQAGKVSSIHMAQIVECSATLDRSADNRTVRARHKESTKPIWDMASSDGRSLTTLLLHSFPRHWE